MVSGVPGVHHYLVNFLTAMNPEAWGALARGKRHGGIISTNVKGPGPGDGRDKKATGARAQLRAIRMRGRSVVRKDHRHAFPAVPRYGRLVEETQEGPNL